MRPEAERIFEFASRLELEYMQGFARAWAIEYFHWRKLPIAHLTFPG